jgi:hypothetical protein
MCLTILVSEKHELVSEKSGKSQGILFHQSAGNPVYTWFMNCSFQLVAVYETLKDEEKREKYEFIFLYYCYLYIINPYDIGSWNIK